MQIDESRLHHEPERDGGLSEGVTVDINLHSPYEPVTSKTSAPAV